MSLALSDTLSDISSLSSEQINQIERVLNSYQWGEYNKPESLVIWTDGDKSDLVNNQFTALDEQKLIEVRRVNGGAHISFLYNQDE